MENPSASFRFRDEGGVERHLTGAPTFRFNKMVRGRSTPVIFGGHFHVTRFGMFRSRAGLALNPWSTAASPRLAYRHRPYLHTQGVIRTAPPSRSRVKNDYSLLGMLSRGKFFHCMKIVMAVLDTAMTVLQDGRSPRTFLQRRRSPIPPSPTEQPAWQITPSIKVTRPMQRWRSRWRSISSS